MKFPYITVGWLSMAFIASQPYINLSYLSSIYIHWYKGNAIYNRICSKDRLCVLNKDCTKVINYWHTLTQLSCCYWLNLQFNVFHDARHGKVKGSNFSILTCVSLIGHEICCSIELHKIRVERWTASHQDEQSIPRRGHGLYNNSTFAESYFA